jgi:outer membrane beta-barrel protein
MRNASEALLGTRSTALVTTARIFFSAVDCPAIGIAVAALSLGSLGLSTRVRAQDMSFSLDESGEAPAEEAPAEEQGSGDVLGELASTPDGAQTATTREAPERTQEAREEIYAVQRVYALRINRAEIALSGAFSLNDPFVSHTGLAAALNYWWTNVLALGVNFIWYEGLESESDLNFDTRRSTRLAVPVNSYQFGAHLNFTYVPIYGKFSFFNEFIFEYDAYIVGGVGMMYTRPIPVIDPDVRSFPYDFRVAFNLGIGLRVFLSRWLAVYAELRDYMYLEQLENLEVGLGPARFQRETWVQSSPSFVNNFTAHIGLTIFLPFDVTYRLPR